MITTRRQLSTWIVLWICLSFRLRISCSLTSTLSCSRRPRSLPSASRTRRRRRWSSTWLRTRRTSASSTLIYIIIKESATTQCTRATCTRTGRKRRTTVAGSTTRGSATFSLCKTTGTIWATWSWTSSSSRSSQNNWLRIWASLYKYTTPTYDFAVKMGIKPGNVYECDKRKLLKGEHC